jgi:hypothetical protein
MRYNALGRPFWTWSPELQPVSKLAGLTMGMHAISRLLANSEAFHAMRNSSEAVDSVDLPLKTPIVEGLLAALHFLSEQARQLSQAALDDPRVD